MKITFKGTDDFTLTRNYLTRLKDLDLRSMFERYGELGIQALSDNTPVESGLTRDSWDYRLEKNERGYSLIWFNTNAVNDIRIVLLIQYGHGTRGGTYVEGKDFINPAMKPIFDQISDEVEKEVATL